MLLNNFNKIIDIEFLTSQDIPVYIVQCPTKGIKPNIEISGTLYTADTGADIEIRLHNFYSQRLMEFQKVRVRAGYEHSSQLCFIGEVVTKYIETPGPEQITLLKCTTVSMDIWLGKESKVDLKAKKGDLLSTVINQIYRQLGLKGSEISVKASTSQLESAFYYNGLAKDAIHKLRNMFEGLVITTEQEVLRAYFTDETKVGSKQISVIKAPPQYAGDVVTIMTQFNPEIKPGNNIDLTTALFTAKYLSAVNLAQTKFNVTSVHFEFSTMGNTNSMTIQGTGTNG